MNLHYTGLGIGRSLVGTGARAFGLTSDAQAPGAHSRTFEEVLLAPHSRDDHAALLDWLMRFADRFEDRPVLLPTCDSDVLFLSAHRTALAERYRLPPGLGAVDALMDKLSLAASATAHGIDTPATEICRSESDAADIARRLRFPLVLKPRSAHEWRRRGVWEQVGARKAIQVETPAQLVAEQRLLSAVASETLVQEYVPGEDRDIVVCCAYVDARGRWLGHFTGRKLLQSPPLFGTGCMVEACDVPEIVPLTQRLLGAVGYAGIAEAEFKRDPRTGTFMLIEVNPRHWDQHRLGAMVGVDLTRIAYDDARGVIVSPVVPRYPSGAAPRWLAERESLLLVAREALHEARARSGGRVGLAGLLAIGCRVVVRMAALARRPLTLPVMSRSEPRLTLRYTTHLLGELVGLARRTKESNG